MIDEPPDADAERALDRRLLAAHVAGDPDAFTELVRRHSSRLWAVAVRTLADREEAADALQEALVNAYRNAGSYRGDAAVTSWLHRIVVNACVDRMRRAKARPTVALPPGDLAATRDEHAATEARIDVQAALARLPEHQRLAIVLVDLHDLSVAEAAEVLGVAEGTVKSRCARGRATLAELLRPGNPPPAPDVAGDGTPERPAPPHRPATAASGDARRPGEPT